MPLRASLPTGLRRPRARLRQRPTPLRPAVLLALALLAPVAAWAQPTTFGSGDDPVEDLQRDWWRRDSYLLLDGGLSLIGAQWRTAGRARFDVVSRSLTARLQGTLRAGVYGSYEPDLDEAYDLLRLVSFARYNPPATSGFYLRVGTLDRTRLGVGHVVNFFNSHAAWDERTVGLEVQQQARYATFSGFTDNLLADGVVGGRLAIMPLGGSLDPRRRSLTVGLNYVTDLATRRYDELQRDEHLEAFNVDAQIKAVSTGALDIAPFASVAWYPDYGSGISFGTDLASDNFIDLARFRLRLALFYNTREFIPGYIGSFYTVNSPHARIVAAEDAGDGQIGEAPVGVALGDAGGGNDFLTELRLLVFQQFEFWYYFRRHYGTRRLSEYHLRVFFRSPRLIAQIGQDRGGLDGFLSLFNDLGDQTLLHFQADYRVYGSFWATLRAQYTFERIADAAGGGERYLVQRRFEPFAGLRVRVW